MIKIERILEIIEQEYKVHLDQHDHKGQVASTGPQGPPGIQGPAVPTNISSNVYPRSEIVNLTQFRCICSLR